MKLYSKLLLGAALASFSALVAALPVSGGVSFVANAPDSGYDNTSVSFGTNPDPTEGNAQVKATTGGYSSYFAFNDTVDFYDFTYSPYGATQKVWEGTGSLDPTNIEFYLENISSSNLDSGTGQLNISGTGYITGGSPGDEVNVLFSFTGNQAGQNNFSWSASTAVPEPGTLALLGLGLAGLGAARRRQKA